ncbi:AAA family ATPase [Spirulina sp. CS-785/01]|uniref:tyrosine-protein kinase family protein n=1 Tax=Spirulina sp. CS-785/01 TaxID=3021716 RepID=UPI00232F8CD8|nr:AAA family ATPase [Spirulina sp. CS-785/01]MDB9313971.1 AAA family ATPase [Spirulina sp. CS-785/01]
MRVITFYSYKGGVGRTLAAANFAVYLAKLGLKTVVIDFDLEAPGIDAKFALPPLADNQKGILDYILEFQKTNQDPENIKELCRNIPLDDGENAETLWLIPAGQYLAETYYKKLNQLDWGIIFSKQRNGVAFFQQFLSHLETELAADFVIIDSRTGITEIAGLCTQQLADEVVMLSSLSSESIRVTKHIKQLIQNSQVAKTLDKEIDVKVVVSRIPKPDNLLEFKEKCCEIFEVEDNKLFFLFSCPALELEEFLAINQAEKSEELVSNYVYLFYGLNIKIADKSIKQEIEKVSRQVLLLPPKESEKRILELATVYPHPEVYRTAMRFFSMTKDTKNMRFFGWKLISLISEDEEAKMNLAQSYLEQAKSTYLDLSNVTTEWCKNALKAIQPLWGSGKLQLEEIFIYVQLLYRDQQYHKSLEIALDLLQPENIKSANPWLLDASVIAANSARAIGDYGLADGIDEKTGQLYDLFERS